MHLNRVLNMLSAIIITNISRSVNHKSQPCQQINLCSIINSIKQTPTLFISIKWKQQNNNNTCSINVYIHTYSGNVYIFVFNVNTPMRPSINFKKYILFYQINGWQHWPVNKHIETDFCILVTSWRFITL